MGRSATEGPGFTELRAVPVKMTGRYMAVVSSFQKFAQSMQLSLTTPELIDAAFVKHIDHLFFEGFTRGEASGTLAAWADMYPA